MALSAESSKILSLVANQYRKNPEMVIEGLSLNPAFRDDYEDEEWINLISELARFDLVYVKNNKVLLTTEGVECVQKLIKQLF